MSKLPLTHLHKFTAFRFPISPFPFLRVVLVVLVPLLQHLLPVDSLAVGYGFGLLHGFVMQLLFGMAQFHCLYCGIVKHLDAPAAQAFVKVGRAKGLPLYVEVGYVELKVRRVWRTIFCCARLARILLPSSLRMTSISRCENFFLPIFCILSLLLRK